MPTLPLRLHTLQDTVVGVGVKLVRALFLIRHYEDYVSSNPQCGLLAFTARLPSTDHFR